MSHQTAAFRPTDRNKNRMDMAKTLGINVSALLNELLEQHGDDALKKRRSALEKRLEQSNGCEPSSFRSTTLTR